MDVNDISFEGNDITTPSNPSTQNNDGNNADTNNNTTALNGDDTPDINEPNNGGTTDDNNQNNTTNSEEGNSNDSSTGELAAGDTIEYDGTTYTVAENGDLVDANNNVFKEAKDVAGWLENLEVEEPADNTNSFDIASLQEQIGVEVTDEEGKPVVFTNDAEGVKAYVNAVMDIRANDLQVGALNKFFNDNPIVKQFADYVYVNNGDYRGFGQIRDRSGITVDKENENQQIAIIKAAAKEFGNKSLTDSYIKYLKDSGTLYDEAVAQLNALVEKDKATNEALLNQAEQLRQQEIEDRNNYFNNVKKVIDGRNIGGYKIPETFVKEVNGQKVSFRANDFYDYVAKPKYVDANNNPITGYQKDLDAMSDEDLLNAELLDAWLKFTGSSYKDLISMAVTENEVRKLKLRSKQIRTTKTVKINKAQSKASIDDIVLD